MSCFFKTKTTFILLITLVLILVGCIGISLNFTCPNKIVFAETISNSESLTSENIVAFSNDNDATFSTKPEPRWFSLAYRIIYAEKDDYSSWTTEAVQSHYSSTSTVASFAINDELFALYGTDATGEEVRLEPVNSLSAANNITAVTSARIRFDHFREVTTSSGGDRLNLNDDTRKLKDISASSGLRISKNETQILYGKILYRSVSGSGETWGTWNYIDLTSNVELPFYQPCNQIAIIYEIREKGPNWWNLYQYHHLVAIYRFDIA